MFQEYINEHFEKGQKVAVIIPERIYTYLEYDTSKADKKIIYVPDFENESVINQEMYIIAIMQAK